MKIRRFVLGKDEADWVKVRNAVYHGHPSYALITVEDLEKVKKILNLTLMEGSSLR